MPRIVRNFWIEGTVDGTATRIATGPKSATGGFELNILMRKDGEIAQANGKDARALRITAYALSNGQLVLECSSDLAPGIILVEAER